MTAMIWSQRPKSHQRQRWQNALTTLITILSLLAITCPVITYGSAASVANDVLSTTNSCCDQFPWTDVHLPTTIIPNHYDLLMKIDLTDFTTHGYVVINSVVMEKTNLIVLHSLELNIIGIKVTVEEEELDFEYRYCEQLQLLSIELEEMQKVGVELQLDITFDGEVSEELVGLYRNKHRYADGRTTHQAVTHFEPTHARRAFPCFDEPTMKAVFKISIEHQGRNTAVSNMEVVSIKDDEDGWTTTHFAPTVTMSTYLIALFVSDFKNVSQTTNGDTKVSVYAPDDLIDDATAYPLEVGVKGLEYLEKYFDIPYALSKIDLVPVDDFMMGAMENWGLMLFRESGLMYDPKKTTTAAKEHITTVIIHELSHQWFGNLVTMKWWNDLWLKEAFANFFENYCTDKVFPEMDLMGYYYNSVTMTALQTDALNTSHPVSVAVNNPAEAGGMFDAISYKKGGHIVHMMMKTLGEDNFNRGVRDYLNTYAYGNAEGKDLWKILEKYDEDKSDDRATVTEIATAWTTTIGHPLLGFELSIEKNAVTITNRGRFVSDVDQQNDAPIELPIPVHLKAMGDNGKMVEQKIWLAAKEREVVVSFDTPIQWVFGNGECSGFYRSLYQEANYDQLTKQLHEEAEVLTGGERASLLSDGKALVDAGQLSIKVLMDMLTYVGENRERSRAAWELISTVLGYQNRLDNEEARQLFKEFARLLLTPTFADLGWKLAEKHSERLAQLTVISSSCHFSVQECIEGAQELFRSWKDDGETIDPDIFSTVTATGIKYGTADDWMFVKAKLDEATNPSTKSTLFHALGKTGDRELLDQYMEMVLNGKDSGLSGGYGVAASNTAVEVDYAWKHLKEHWDNIYERLHSGVMLGGVAGATIGRFATPELLADVQNFMNGIDLGQSERSFESALEGVRLNIQWRSRVEQPLKQWLEEWNRVEKCETN